MTNPTRTRITRLLPILVAIIAALAVPLAPARAQDLIYGFMETQAFRDHLYGQLTKESFPAPALGKNAERRVYVYTPPGYTGVGSRTYPVLILLHGTPGDPAEWLFRGGGHRIIDTMIHTGKIAPFIAVFPDGHGPFWKSGSEWADAVNGRCNMDTAISRDLPRWLQAHYRVASNPDQWAIGGLSEGGYGAANLLVRHPDRFHTALVLSGDFEVSEEWPDANAVFGSNPAVRDANSPMQAIRHLSPAERSDLQFYVAVGADDDTDLITQDEAFVSLCKALHVPVKLDQDPGAHQWGFWSKHLRSGLTEWAARLGGTH